MIKRIEDIVFDLVFDKFQIDEKLRELKTTSEEFSINDKDDFILLLNIIERLKEEIKKKDSNIGIYANDDKNIDRLDFITSIIKILEKRIFEEVEVLYELKNQKEDESQKEDEDKKLKDDISNLVESKIGGVEDSINQISNEFLEFEKTITSLHEKIETIGKDREEEKNKVEIPFENKEEVKEIEEKYSNSDINILDIKPEKDINSKLDEINKKLEKIRSQREDLSFRNNQIKKDILNGFDSSNNFSFSNFQNEEKLDESIAEIGKGINKTGNDFYSFDEEDFRKKDENQNKSYSINLETKEDKKRQEKINFDDIVKEEEEIKIIEKKDEDRVLIEQNEILKNIKEETLGENKMPQNFNLQSVSQINSNNIDNQNKVEEKIYTKTEEIEEKQIESREEEIKEEIEKNDEVKNDIEENQIENNEKEEEKIQEKPQKEAVETEEISLKPKENEIYRDDIIVAYINGKSKALGEIIIEPVSEKTFDKIELNHFTYMMIFSKVFSSLVFEATNAHGTNIIFDYKSNKFHIIPRFQDDNLPNLKWESIGISQEELEEIREKILLKMNESPKEKETSFEEKEERKIEEVEKKISEVSQKEEEQNISEKEKKADYLIKNLTKIA